MSFLLFLKQSEASKQNKQSELLHIMISVLASINFIVVLWYDCFFLIAQS